MQMQKIQCNKLLSLESFFYKIWIKFLNQMLENNLQFAVSNVTIRE